MSVKLAHTRALRALLRWFCSGAQRGWRSEVRGHLGRSSIHSSPRSPSAAPPVLEVDGPMSGGVARTSGLLLPLSLLLAVSSDEGGGASIKPNCILSSPAHAIMTPLSVHQRGGGSTSSRPWAADSSASCPRMYWLQATPPATTRCLTSGWTSRVQVIARLSRSVRCLQATYWKEAAMSALTFLTAASSCPDGEAGKGCSTTPTSPPCSSPAGCCCCEEAADALVPRFCSIASRTLVLRPA
mmetsp:Transcript_13765/g.29632  ORF Transcript_13765/g.29632 Transcript_13765/m.29632 type:complete len:241 (-) Transcript_13765:922-1644(-)